MSFAEQCWKAMGAANRGDPRYACVIDDKLVRRAILIGGEFPVAELLNIATPDNVDLAVKHVIHEHGTCVVKPRGGAASIGVRAIVARDDGWWDVIRNQRVNLAVLSNAAQNVQREHPSWPSGWLIEELLPNHDPAIPLADEYKVYVFGGVPRLVQARRHVNGPDVYSWFTPEWDRVKVGKLDDKQADLPMPSNTYSLLGIAEQVAMTLPRLPFVRVDIFDTPDGFKVGEVNGWIGDPSFNEEWDAKLGAWWKEAEDA